MRFPASIVFILTLIIFSLSCEKESCDCNFCTGCELIAEDGLIITEKEGWIVINNDSSTYMIGIPYYNDPVFYVPCRLPDYLDPVNMRPVIFSGTVTDVPLNNDESIKSKYICISLDTIYYSNHRCDTIPGYPLTDLRYPTSYYKLSDERYIDLKTQYESNKYCGFTGSIDQFGFCETSVYRNRTCSPVYKTFSNSQAEYFVLSFIRNNLPFTGIKDISQITEMDFRSWGTPAVPDSKAGIEIGNQYVYDLEVQNTRIVFWMDAGGVERVSGHWYPEIYVPVREEISFIKAQNMMIGKKFKWMCWTMVEESITQNTIWDTKMRKSIVPVIKDDRIELRVVWVLKTDHHFNIEVDTMTGEVIRYYSDLIC
jgi:hypothetical protein